MTAAAWRRGPPGGWYLLAGAAWLGRYLTLGNPPWMRAPLWLSWFDQSRYLRSALALSGGVLSPSEHWYPLLYPLCAVPFAWMAPSDPFFLLDLALYLATCAALVRVAARVGVSRGPATVCFVATTLVQTGFASAWVHPWTTTLSAALIWWLIAIVAHRRDDGAERGRWHMVAVGAMLAALPLTRPLDVLLSGVGLAAILWVERRRPLLATIVPLAGGAAAVALPYALLHLAIYGPHRSAYMIAAARTGFVPADLGWKAYVLLVRAEPWYPGSRAILSAVPWAVPGVVGLIVRAIRAPRDRLVLGLFAGLALPASALMLTYVDLQPPGLWEFGNVHYFKWLMPMLGLGVVWFVRACLAPGERRWVLAVGAPIVLVLGIRIDPLRVDDAAPARLLVYAGRTDRDWAEAYFAPVLIRDGAGALRNVDDFHQVPGPGGERALAVRRLFARAPRRYDPGDARAAWGRPPSARYGERVTFLGLPR